MSKQVDPESLLNTFRKQLDDPRNETLTTDDLTNEFDVGKRTMQGYVQELESEGRLVIEAEGKPNHWRLAKSEPTEPVYDLRVGKAKRWANKSRMAGTWAFMCGVSLLAGAGLITSNFTLGVATGVTIPFVDGQDVLIGGLFGILGTVLFLFSFIFFIAAICIPRYVKWEVNQT